MAQSYSNPFGSGFRLIVTTDATAGAGKIVNMLEGSTTNNSTNSWWWNSGQSGRSITFDFLIPRIIDEAKWYQSNTITHGTWKWQASHDGSTWSDIGSTFTLGTSTIQTLTALNGNTTAYRYYRMLQTSGTTSNNPWLQEIEFKIDNGTGTGSTSYSNWMGSGYRLHVTSNSANAGSGGNGWRNLMNGSFLDNENGAWSFGAFETSRTITFYFGIARCIDEAKWYQNSTSTFGTWKWQGSNDDTTYTDIGGTFTLGGSTTQTHTTLNGNTDKYKYYRLFQVSGSTSSGTWLREIEFRIDDATDNVTTTVNQTLPNLSQAVDVFNDSPAVVSQQLFGPSQSLTGGTYLDSNIDMTLETISMAVQVSSIHALIGQELPPMKQKLWVNRLAEPGNLNAYSYWLTAPD